MQDTRTSGAAVGRAIGSTAAHTEHYVRSVCSYAVAFTGDVGRGAAEGYATTAAARAAQREARAAARKAALTPETPIGVAVV